MNNDSTKITSSSGIFKTIYDSSCYSLLFGKQKCKFLKYQLNNSSYFEVCTSLF